MNFGEDFYEIKLYFYPPPSDKNRIVVANISLVLLFSRLEMCFEHQSFLYNKYHSWHLIHHYKSNILLSGKVNI